MNQRVILVFLFLFSIVLRAWAAHHGSPFCYHVDEHWIFHSAFQMILNQSWDPNWFSYSSLLIYLFKVVVMLMQWIHPVSLIIPKELWISQTDILPSQFYLLYSGRLMVGIFGAMTVVMVYLILIRLTSRVVAGTLALLYSIYHVNIYYSSFLRPESLVILFQVASLYFLQRYLSQKKNQWIWLAGIMIGLATGTKYTGAFFGLTSILFLFATDDSKLVKLKQSVRMTSSAILAFLLSTPYIFLKFQRVYQDVFHVVQMNIDGQVGEMGSATENFMYYLQLLYSTDKLFLLFYVFLASLILCFLNNSNLNKESKLILRASVFYVVSYVLFLCLFRYRVERNLVLVLPFMFIACAITFHSLLQRQQTWVRQGVKLVLSLCFGFFILYSVDQLKKYNQPTPQDYMAHWFHKHAPASSRVIKELDSPMIDPNKYKVVHMYAVALATPEDLLKFDPHYLIMNEFIHTSGQNIEDPYIRKFNQWIWSKEFEYQKFNTENIPLGANLRVYNFQKYKNEFKITFKEFFKEKG